MHFVKRVVGFVLCSFIAGGCATHRAPEPAVHTGAPHISWVIASGKENSSSSEVDCDSGDPSRCLVVASSSAERRDGSFTIYLHPAAVEVLYTGVVEIGFLSEDRPTPVSLEVNQKVPRTNNVGTPISAILVGHVTSKPGRYSVVIKIEAQPAGKPKVRLNSTVVVTVNAPAN